MVGEEIDDDEEVEVTEAVRSELVLALGDFIAEELSRAVTDVGFGVLEEDVVFFTA